MVSSTTSGPAVKAVRKRRRKSKEEPQTKMVTMKVRYDSAIGLDVHHSILVACYVHSTEKGQLEEYGEFGTGKTELARFGQWCRERNPEIIVMESTGVLWYLPYDELSDRFFKKEQLVVVNARDHKGRPGHKTDRQDAHHLAQLGMLNSFRPSFVLPRELRDIREVARTLKKHVEALAKAKNVFQKELNSAGCRASAVFSDVYGVAAKAIINALIDGNEEILRNTVRERSKRLKASEEEILEVLRPLRSSEKRYVLKANRDDVRILEENVKRDEQFLEQRLQPYWHWVELLQSLPGIQKRSAMMLFAEFGTDLSDFSTSKHLASWAGLCPGVNQSAGKAVYSRKRKTRGGNKYVRRILIEAAQAIGRTKSGSAAERFQVFKERRGHRKAVVAIAHMLIRFIFAMYRDDAPYEDLHQDEGRLEKHRIIKYRRSCRGLAEAHVNILKNGTAVNTDTGLVYE